jgi:hypothetical protein
MNIFPVSSRWSESCESLHDRVGPVGDVSSQRRGARGRKGTDEGTDCRVAV